MVHFTHPSKPDSIVRRSPLANKPETEHAGGSVPPPVPGLITSETATAVTLKRQEGKEDVSTER
jgi:hypothetical protein